MIFFGFEMALTIKQVEAAKPQDKQYKLSDDDGLYLLVHPNGSKYWRYNYVNSETKKQATKSYGVFPRIGIADARRAHAEFRDALYAPNAVDLDQSGALLVDVFRQFVIKRLKHLSPKYAAQVERRVYADVIGTQSEPILGWRAMRSITRKDLVQVLDQMCARGVIDSAHRMAETLKRIFDFAVDIGELESHPAAGLERGLPAAPQVRHMAAVTGGELPQLVRDIDMYPVNPVVRLGMLLMLATFVRTGQELRRVRWEEFDWDARVWEIPSVRMKGKIATKRVHFVPLSDFAIKILSALLEINGDSEYVLASLYHRDQPVNGNFILDALEIMGYKGRMTGHGFRSVASTWFNERGFNPDAIEVQLSHKIESSNAVRGAYNRALYWDERVRMMDAWGAYLEEILQVNPL